MNFLQVGTYFAQFEIHRTQTVCPMAGVQHNCLGLCIEPLMIEMKKEIVYFPTTKRSPVRGRPTITGWQHELLGWLLKVVYFVE